MSGGAMEERRTRRRTPTTTIAGVLMLAITIPFLVNGFRFASLAANPERVGDDVRSMLIVMSVPAGDTEAGNLMAMGALVYLGFSALAIGLAIGVLTRRQQAQHATVVVFALFTLVTLPLSIGGLLENPPPPDARFGFITGLVDASVVALLLLPMTVDDFENAEVARRHERLLREDARAERRAARDRGR